MESLHNIVGTPPPPYLRGQGVGPSKNESLGVVPKILLKKGGGDIEMGGCHFFWYFTVQLHLLCVGRSFVYYILIL